MSGRVILGGGCIHCSMAIKLIERKWTVTRFNAEKKHGEETICELFFDDPDAVGNSDDIKMSLARLAEEQPAKSSIPNRTDTLRSNYRLDEADSDLLPMTSWERTNSFYGGNVVIREIFEWDRTVPQWISQVPGFPADQVCHLKDTFVELHTGEIEDIHHFYFASGDLLKKLEREFSDNVQNCWRFARRIVPQFPHHTLVDMRHLLDPFVDDRSRYFNEYDYASIKQSALKSYALTINIQGETEKRNSFSRVELWYRRTGDLGGIDCTIHRRN